VGRALVTRPAHGGFQTSFQLLPAVFLCLRAFLKFGALFLDDANFCLMLPFGFIECGFRPGNCPLPPFTLLRFRCLLLSLFACTPPLLLLEGEGGLDTVLPSTLPCGCFFGFLGGFSARRPGLITGRSVGKWAFS
jgi:hypothetical protein